MQRLDYFGQEISIRFRGFKTHKTKFGFICTLVMISVLVVRVSYLINNFVQGSNPTVLFQERQVKNPKKFNINPNSLSMAFGIIAADYSYYVDQSILQIESFTEMKTVIFNETTQKFEDKWERIPFQMERCTKDHIINNEEILAQFPSLDQHFCFPKDLTLHIEGEYNQDSFAQVFVNIKRCKGVGCQDEKVIDQALKLFWGEVIFTDVYISPQNKSNPFTKYVRDAFWELSDNFPKKVYMEYRNNYVESDFGFFIEDSHTDLYPSFSKIEEMVKDYIN